MDEIDTKDAVRYGRVPRKSREQNEDQVVTSQVESEVAETTDESSQEQDNDLGSTVEFIVKVCEAHSSHISFNQDKAGNVLRRPAIENWNEVTKLCDGQTMDSTENQRLILFQRLIDHLTVFCVETIEFAKRIPGFYNLDSGDKIIFSKFGVFRLWLIHIARTVNMEDSSIMFSDGSYLTKQQLEIVFNSDFVSHFFEFCITLKSVDLNDHEIALYAVTVLLTVDTSLLKNRTFAESTRERTLEAFRFLLSKFRQNGQDVFQFLMSKLPQIQALSATHNNLLDWYRNREHCLKIFTLFAEVFHFTLPKSEPEIVNR